MELYNKFGLYSRNIYKPFYNTSTTLTNKMPQHETKKQLES